MSLTLFNHIKQSQGLSKKCYLPKVKKFALTLHFLSPKAYEFVRPILHLPHRETLRLWKSSIECAPGYLDNMMQAAHIKCEEIGNNMCSLIIDEMSIRQDTDWVPSLHQNCGLVDHGGGPIGSQWATKALVFLLVGLKNNWKAPIAYFMTDKLNAKLLSGMIREAVMRAADHKLLVKTVVADGLKTNNKAAKLLGCDLSPPDFSTHFMHPHPHFATEKIYFISDPPHMLKLTRNLLGQKRIIQHDTHAICWKYIQALHHYQERESVYLANKLTTKHINFHNVIMKVHLAAQTLSASVATAIDHLRDDLGLPEFQNSEATCHFIRTVDRLFDTLNGRNPYGKGFKAPLREDNMNSWLPFLKETKEYLMALQDSSGKPLIDGYY